MIPCQACKHQNPLGTRFCRSCGARLVVRQEAVVKAVADDLAEGRAMRWLARGHSTVAMGGFILVCALVLRYAVVPPFPRADIPPVDAGGLVPDHLPPPPAPPPAPPAAPRADQAAASPAPAPVKPADPSKPADPAKP